MDWGTLLSGGAIGAFMAAAANVAGSWFGRSTTLGGKNIDDRQALTTQLMGQVSELYEKNGELNHSIEMARQREFELLRLLISFEGELRVISALSSDMTMELTKDEPRLEDLTNSVEFLSDACDRMRKILENVDVLNHARKAKEIQKERA